jgi:GTP cyclohydrolase I
MVDREAARAAIAEFLRALGHDPSKNVELRETPLRVTDAFADELLAGYAVDIAALLGDGSERSSDNPSVVAITGIRTATLCPHHLLPGLGTGAVVYKPGERVLGLGTLSRLLDAFARRLSLQEAVTENVVEALISRAGARGAYCELTLVHGCLSARGACQAGAQVTTTARSGDLTDAEVLLALRGSRDEAR